MNALRKCTAVICIAILVYLVAALFFRSYRMNPENRYYGNYLPSASPGILRTDEEINRYIESRTRPPTVLERFFMPAESLLTRFDL